jgi:hypothetical protein
MMMGARCVKDASPVTGGPAHVPAATSGFGFVGTPDPTPEGVATVISRKDVPVKANLTVDGQSYLVAFETPPTGERRPVVRDMWGKPVEDPAVLLQVRKTLQTNEANLRSEQFGSSGKNTQVVANNIAFLDALGDGLAPSNAARDLDQQTDNLQVKDLRALHHSLEPVLPNVTFPLITANASAPATAPTPATSSTPPAPATSGTVASTPADAKPPTPLPFSGFTLEKAGMLRDGGTTTVDGKLADGTEVTAKWSIKTKALTIQAGDGTERPITPSEREALIKVLTAQLPALDEMQSIYVNTMLDRLREAGPSK